MGTRGVVKGWSVELVELYGPTGAADKGIPHQTILS